LLQHDDPVALLLLGRSAGRVLSQSHSVAAPPPVVLVTPNITPSTVISRAVAPDVGSSVVELLINVSCIGEVARDVVGIVSWYTPRLTVFKLAVSVVRRASSG
jgi:hypothetical protein